MSNDIDEARLDALIAGVGAIREHYIEHDEVLYVKRELRTLLKRDNRASEGFCMPLIGEAGSGKTKLIDDFAEEHPRRKHALVNDRGEKADHAPVVVVSVPDAGKKALTERLYKAASGVTMIEARTRFDLLEQAVRILEEMQTKLIIFEETHQSFGKTGEHVEAVATFFKDLLNRGRFSIVLAGTSVVMRVFTASKELNRRKPDVLRLNPFPWNDPRKDERPAFMDILDGFDRELAAVLGTTSGLSEPGMALRLHVATGGLIGLLAILLERAGTFAARDLVGGGEPRIGMHHLARAFSGLDADGRPNPFKGAVDRGFPNLLPNAAAAQAAAPVAAVRPVGRRRRANPDANFRP